MLAFIYSLRFGIFIISYDVNSHLKRKYIVNDKSICGPRILHHAFPLDGELVFLFAKILFLEKDLESPLIFVLFLKGKQNKKEKP